MSVSSSGFAIRSNGSCQANEVDCGATVAPYHACCPAKSFCPQQYNVDCCPSSENCTSTLLKNPQCANETWDLYDNGGYFCCQKGFTGYAAAGGSDGCAEPGYAFMSGQVLLPIISSGRVSTSSASSTRTLPTSTSTTVTTTPTTTSETHSKSNTGPVVGGIVGGVGGAFLITVAAWIWWRQRSLAKKRMDEQISQQGVNLEKDSRAVPPRGELDGHHAPNEVSGTTEPGQLAAHHGVSELEG